MSSKTPIVYIIFNRLDCIQQTFPIIRFVKPHKLFIISDGPRPEKPEDPKKVQACRDYVDTNIDWDCDIHRLYRAANLGCGLSPSMGLDWVFSQVDRAIILEDDILPDLTFFDFCDTLLRMYEHEKQVFGITGRNQFGSWGIFEKPYFFTHKISQLGWATWKRAWKMYNFSMDDWKYFRNRFRLFKTLLSINDFLIDYIFINSLYHYPRKDAWDYQWSYTCLKHSGLFSVPSKNLTSHIGMGENATHTKNWDEDIEVYPYCGEFPKYKNPKPDRGFQRKFYKSLTSSEKRKMIVKLLKNELKFLLNSNN
jgi:hypothetical protein